MSSKTVNLKFEDGVRTLTFTEVTLPKEEWQSIKETAAPEQLFLLGIGTKLRVNAKGKYLLSLLLLAVIGIAVALAMFVDTAIGIIVGVIGYITIAVLLCKYLRIKETYNAILSALKGTDYAKALEELNKKNWFLTFLLWELDSIIFSIAFVVEGFFMIFLEKVFPSITVSISNATFAVPEECGMDDLVEMSNFYHKTFMEKMGNVFNDLTTYFNSKEEEYKKEHTFTLVGIETVLKPTSISNYDSTKDLYEYSDANGNKWYSRDNKTFARETSTGIEKKEGEKLKS